MRKKGFTLIELLVVIAIIAMLMAILMPALSKVKKIAMRVVCGTNLKGLGTAQTVYANDYDDEYVVQGKTGKHTWDWVTGGYDDTAKDWSVANKITIGASLYLLVREADVSPKSFVCPASDQIEFDGKNRNNLDVVQLWDFGNNAALAGSGAPYNHVSYSYHQPYASGGGKSRYAANGTRSAAFAVMADRNPYFDSKLTMVGAALDENNWRDGVHTIAPYYRDSTISESHWKVQRANAQPHDKESQNVLFADGHTANEKTVDVGVKNDQIYLPRAGSTEDQIRMGAYPSAPITTFDLTTQPISSDDSYLVNDNLMTVPFPY